MSQTAIVRFRIGNVEMDGYVAKEHPNGNDTVINNEGGWIVDPETALFLRYVPIRNPFILSNKVNYP